MKKNFACLKEYFCLWYNQVLIITEIMKGILAYTWNNYLVEENIPHSEQNHLRNSFSIVCLHLPGLVLCRVANNKRHGFSPSAALSLVRQMCKESITMQFNKCYCHGMNCVLRKHLPRATVGRFSYRSRQ